MQDSDSVGVQAAVETVSIRFESVHEPGLRRTGKPSGRLRELSFSPLALMLNVRLIIASDAPCVAHFGQLLF